jgi:ATP-dependent RNA helicase RhlE
VLIIAPTRELARQIEEDIRSLARFTRIRTATVYGGVSATSQIVALCKNPDIVVACPGRLLDLFQRGAVRLDGIEALVLDEADRMFDMGFLPDIRRILAELPAKRQNLLFAATMPAEIRQLAARVLRDPHVVELNHSSPSPTIEQTFYRADGEQKRDLLERVLGEPGLFYAIVFTRTKHRAKRLAKQLGASGHRAVALQGNMTQVQRDKAIDGFRRRKFDVLVATDVAARGIDVEHVSHVVNFDMPGTVDAYTHRIGRTGRSGRAGKAYTFVTPEDRAIARVIEGQRDTPEPALPPPLPPEWHESSLTGITRPHDARRVRGGRRGRLRA